MSRTQRTATLSGTVTDQNHAMVPGAVVTIKNPPAWEVTTFLSHIDKLPPRVAAEWKTAAGTAGANSSPDASTPVLGDRKSMSMTMH